MPVFLSVPKENFDIYGNLQSLVGVQIHYTLRLSGLENGQDYRLLLLSTPSPIFTPSVTGAIMASGQLPLSGSAVMVKTNTRMITAAGQLPITGSAAVAKVKVAAATGQLPLTGSATLSAVTPMENEITGSGAAWSGTAPETNEIGPDGATFSFT